MVSAGESGVLSGSFKHPLTVIKTFLDPALSLCSHSHTPCQVPRFSFPSETGTVRLEPRKQAFTWAGMSSGPSQESEWKIFWDNSVEHHLHVVPHVWVPVLVDGER